MNSRERVAAALRREQPDRVPWIEIQVDPYLGHQLMQWGGVTDQASSLEKQQYTVEEAKTIAALLKLDNISFIMRAPTYTHMHQGKDGRLFYGEGMLKSEADLDKVHLPDPNDDRLYDEASEFARNKGDFSAWFATRIGVFSVMLGMGQESFSLALYDNRPFIEKLLDIYCDWVCVVAERVCAMGFDVFISTDDMAFNTSTMFSPKVFRDLVLPRYRRAQERISIPWLIHSDGNMWPFMDDLLTLNIAGFHPNEKGAMEIRETKRRLGHRLCVLGNVDLVTLGLGTPEEVDREVYELIRDLGPGGGYIIASGNSLAGYLPLQNVLAMSKAIQKYGEYPIDLP